MSSKGWVSRQREQFEQFARTEVRPQVQVFTQVFTQVPSQVPILVKSQEETYKPMEDGDMKDEEQKTETKTEMMEEKPADDPTEINNFRSVAIKESSKPSGAGAKETKKIEPGTNNNNNNNNNNLVNQNTKPISPMKGGLGRSLTRGQEQQEVTRKVYSQYREMLRRYEQSSRL